MIKVEDFFFSLANLKIDFYTGVPDSLLKEFCAYMAENMPYEKNIITSNEGAAVSLAAGYHLSTGKTPLVYLQNSGLGNTINPLLSLADKEVYSIPMILLIGWRGEPGIKDEPQHIKQGRVQNTILDALEVPYSILDSQVTDIDQFLDNIINISKKENSPVAIIVRKNTFDTYHSNIVNKPLYNLTRESAIENIVNILPEESILVSTTGMASRELFEYRERTKQGHHKDFLTVGSMGHCSQIALGMALNIKTKVICIDGDGSFLMHMGSSAIIGNFAPTNYLHIVINNGAHDSVGGQPTVGHSIDIIAIAKGCGYKNAVTVSNTDELIAETMRLANTDGPNLLEVRVKKGSRKDLGRPTSSPVENKRELMTHLLKQYK